MMQSKVGESDVSALIKLAARRASEKETKSRANTGRFGNSESSGRKWQRTLRRFLSYRRSTGIGLAFVVAASTITARRRQNVLLDNATNRLDIAEKQRDDAAHIIAKAHQNFTSSADAASADLLAVPEADRSARLKDWIHSCFDRAMESNPKDPSTTATAIDK